MNARNPLVLVLATLVAGCGAPGAGEGSATPATMPAAVRIDTPGPPGAASAATRTRAPEPTVDPASAAAVEAAKTAFATDFGVPVDSVQVVAVEATTWPDSSLGCPEPGMNYLQVLTPGYRVTLESGEQRATYHTSDGSAGPVNAVRCEQGASTAGGRQLNLDLLSAGALDKARRDLAGRLGGQPEISLAGRALAGVTQLVCDGTPVPERPDAPAYVVFEFHLQVGDTQYLYRSAGDKFVYCGLYVPPAVDEHGNPTQ